MFVVFGLVLAGLVIFLLGGTRKSFERSSTFELVFEEVAGLKQGAPVQMGGVHVGQVTTVGYGSDPADPRIYVQVRIVAAEARRLGADSVATIINKGFLGDKMLVITKGSGDALPDGARLKTEEPADLFAKVSEFGGEAGAAVTEVQRLARSLADEQLHADLRASVKKIDRLLGQLTEGDGYPRRFLADKEEAARISRTVESVDRSAAELAGALREIRLLVAQVRTGPGFAHDVVFGAGPQKEIAQFGAAAEEVATALREIRTGSGFAREVLFGGGGTKDAVTNLTAITADLRDIVRGIKDGKGTLGALLVDPSVYEDVKRLLGDVQRNAVLRALVRYSVQQNERTAPPSAPAPPLAPAPSPAP